MNTTRQNLCLSVMMLVGAAFFFGGCGPQNLDDPDYLEQLSESGYIDDAAVSAQNGDQEGMADGEEGMGAMANENGQGAALPQAAPAVGAIPPAVVPPPVPVVQLPGAVIRVPPRVEPVPPVITHSAEERLFKRDILHIQDIVRPAPNINNHLIKNNLITNHLYKTNIINQPSFANVTRVAAVAAETHAVLPTTEVTAPPVFVGGPIIGPGIFPGGCHPALSIYRRCLPPPVPGPYFR